jgi:hypothetical protein
MQIISVYSIRGGVLVQDYSTDRHKDVGRWNGRERDKRKGLQCSEAEAKESG